MTPCWGTGQADLNGDIGGFLCGWDISPLRDAFGVPLVEMTSGGD